MYAACCELLEFFNLLKNSTGSWLAAEVLETVSASVSACAAVAISTLFTPSVCACVCVRVCVKWLSDKRTQSWNSSLWITCIALRYAFVLLSALALVSTELSLSFGLLTSLILISLGFNSSIFFHPAFALSCLINSDTQGSSHGRNVNSSLCHPIACGLAH